MAKKKAKRKVSTKAKAKRLVKRTEKAAKREGKKVKRGAGKFGSRVKKTAKRVGKKTKKVTKRVGKKAKKFVKTDTGRATIGAGTGALLLGPIGAVAGAAVGLATRKKNPEQNVKIASAVGSLMLDYHKASPTIEHVAASALRGERVELSKVKMARATLKSLIRKQKREAEREQLEDLVEALDKIIDKAMGSRWNPSLQAAVKRQRQSRAKKAATGMVSRSKVYSEVKSKSLAKRLREINPEPVSYTEIMRSHKRRAGALSDAVLKREIVVLRKEPHVSKRGLIFSLTKVYESEAKKRGMKVNPKAVAERKRSIGLKRRARPSTLDELAGKYRNARKRWLVVSTKASSTTGGVSRSRKRMDDAENQLVLYAEISNMSPENLRRYMLHTQKKEAKERNPSNPLSHISKGAGVGKIRDVVSKNVSIEMAGGTPQKQAVAIAISTARADAKKVGGTTATLIRAEYPKPNPVLPATGMLSNPKKSRKKRKKKVAKKVSEWQRMIRRCQKLWDHYCERPSKKRLKDVFVHLEKMEGHGSKKVREERGKCMRVAKSEAKRIRLNL